jgi:uncharacterized protein (DUF1330 family)
MNLSHKAAIALYCLVGFLLLLGGGNYIFRTEYLPYHGQATQVPWGALSPGHQGTYLGLMKGGGAGSAAAGLTLILLSAFGLRQRRSSVFWILPLLALTYLTTLNYSTYYMNSTTSGGPPIQVGLALLVMVSLAAILTYIGRPSRSQLSAQATERRGEARAYLFIKTKIHDVEQYAKYVAEVRSLAARWQSRYIVRSRPIEVLEGSPEQWGDFLLLVSEWPSVETAREFWNSPEYRQVRELRAGAGEVHVVLAEELPSPAGLSKGE